MQAYTFTALITLIAIATYFYMGLRVGGARGKYNVAAPATTGDPIFERHFRVHMNTLEGMPLFLPSLWLFAGYWGDVLAAAIGAVWIIGRVIYMVTYVADPSKRSVGFLTQFLAFVVLFFGSLAGVVMAIPAALAQ
jgi:glutathione S-transferase